MRQALNFAIVALIALAFVVVPGGDPLLAVILALLSIAFFAAIALLAARFYREYRFTLDSLPDGDRLVLYGSIGLALLTFAATQRLFDAGGAGVLGWILLLVLASFGVFWVYTRARQY